MTDWKERAERAEAELARLRKDVEFYRNFAAEVLAVKRLPMPHDMEALCRTAYENRYHKIKAEVGYDEWRLIWVRAIASHEVAPPAQPAEQQAQTVCKRTLVEIDARLRECSIVGASAADAYDTFYQHMVETALAAQPAEPVQRLSDVGIEALAGKHGTTYRNRHFPTQPAFSFSNGSLHRFVRDIESAIQPQPGWRDVESAPKDGSSYLVADAERGFVAPHIRGVIHNNPGTNWDWQYGEAVTHWMPLPSPPHRRGRHDRP